MRRAGYCAVIFFTVLNVLTSQSIFTNVTAAVGINVPPSPNPAGFYRGAAWLDADGDGDLDLFAPGGPSMPVTLFYNNGTGFTAQPIQIPSLPSANRLDHQCIAGDVDNDGDEDVFLAEGGIQGVGNQPIVTQNYLFINSGNGAFTEEAATRGVAASADYYSASFFDFDRDGWLDLAIGALHDLVPPISATVPRILYRNTGGGYFTDVTAATGTANPGKSLATIGFDYDSDGWTDIIFGNDRGTAINAPTGIMRNGRNGTFSNVGPAIGASWPIDCMGITVGDIENDGDWDIFMTNVPVTTVPVGPLLMIDSGSTYQTGTNYWSNAAAWGLSTGEEGWNAQFFDFDLDGWLDLWIQNSAGFNRLFQGAGAPPFADVTGARGLFATPPDGAGCVVDYDNDGDLDIYMAGQFVSALLFRNPVAGSANAPNWLALRLIGTNSNRSAIGARAIVTVGTQRQQRMVVSGEGYLCDGDHRLHFGLGAAAAANEVEIRWPSGTVNYLANVPANQFVAVNEPRFVPATAPLLPGTVSSYTIDLPSDVGLTYVAGLTLNAASEFYLPDQRAIRVDVNDPMIALTTTYLNPVFGFFAGTMTPGGVTVTVTLPAIPQLTGLSFYGVAVTLDAARPGGIKSIVGPQKFTIN